MGTKLKSRIKTSAMRKLNAEAKVASSASEPPDEKQFQRVKKQLQKETTTSHYVDNKKFLAEMISYRKEVKLAKKEKREPRIPEYIGECILHIADGLSRKSNFANYQYREDMVSDGIENCLQYINNFDPKKSSNPFSYFTQIIYYAFLRRIEKEKKQLATKYKAIQHSLLHDEHDELIASDGKYGSEYADSHMREFLEQYDTKKAEKKRTRKEGKTVNDYFEFDKNEDAD